MDDIFDDKNYSVPEGPYMTLQPGENNFRIMGKIVTGYEYWNMEDKPVRQKAEFIPRPTDVKPNKDGSEGVIKHFWSMVVWNYGADKIQVLQLGQKGAINSIMALIENPKWGNPKNYDLTITKSGSGLTTKYAVVSSPPSPADPAHVAAFTAANINLEADLFGAKPVA